MDTRSPERAASKGSVYATYIIQAPVEHDSDQVKMAASNAEAAIFALQLYTFQVVLD